MVTRWQKVHVLYEDFCPYNNNCVLLDWIKFLLTLSFPHSVWAQLLDRSQQRLILVLIPLSLFIPVKKDNSMDYDGFHDPSESMQVLIDESCEVWINVSTWFFVLIKLL